MAYEDFLEGFAKAQKIASVDLLLSDYSKKYSFQIRSRDRAKMFIDELRSSLNYDFAGKRVLDIGCAYGSFSIELSHIGAEVTGIDVSPKWLHLAELNAKNESDAQFMLVDGSSRAVLEKLNRNHFDLIIMNDVLEHIYDTSGLLHNCRELLVEGGLLYFKVPNGLATRNVLSEGHKKVFGISLLAPDYWQWFVSAPFSIYYRRLEYFEALFQRFGLQLNHWITDIRDSSIEKTRQKIIADKVEIEDRLREGFDSAKQTNALTVATDKYFYEIERDLDVLGHSDLYIKYRATFWEGVLQKSSVAREPSQIIAQKISSGRRAWYWVNARLPIAARLIRRSLSRSSKGGD